ncbi:MAG: hypothetical protein PHC34_08260 [Candidatus Gastranaerophilales bacterium]|nr:hypothetical protein [Candidatus Gastranaerophilales bacterium]
MAVIKESLIKNIFSSLGENNHPTYAVMAIAICKGIFRPIFTMMDEKQDPESKKYAAFREGVTELIAFPTYFLSGKLADILSPKFLDATKVKDEKNPTLVLTEENRAKFDTILGMKKTLKKEKLSSEVIKDRINEAVNALGNEKGLFSSYKKSRAIVGETSSFLGVCVAALLVIPGLCNVFLPPIMNGFKKLQDSKKQNTIQPQNTNIENVIAKFDTNPQIIKPNRPSPMEIYQMSKSSSGMRVGN